MLEKLDNGEGRGGVIGIRCRPEWDGPEITHRGQPVRVAPCLSALAVRAEIAQRDPERWLVVLTDRDDDDLGLGIRAHFSGRRLRQPDPWDAVRAGFAANAIDQGLANSSQRTGLATSLLLAAPTGGWPPARGGLLTLDHALGSVAAARLGLGAYETDVDLPGILRWSVGTADGVSRTRALADLTALAGPQLADRVIDWIAARSGVLQPAVAALLRGGRATDLVPLGLAARVVASTTAESGPRALIRREAGVPVGAPILAAWADVAEEVARQFLDSNETELAAAVLARADVLVDLLEAADFAGASPLLRRGLSQRLATLGAALHLCVERAPARAAASVDDPLADIELVESVEAAWREVDSHMLSGRRGEVRVDRGLAGVRLTRWLAHPSPSASGLADEIARYWGTDAWVDRAVADAWTGVDDEELARGLRAVLAATRLRRAAHDGSFALAAAAAAADSANPAEVSYAENVLHDTVLPLARNVPVLLILADGMSCASAAEIVDDIKAGLDSWQELLPEETAHRLSTMAVFPTITEVSRTSLLTGVLSAGAQPAEREGFAELCRSHQVTGRLFHKLSMESSEAGFALAHDVSAAIEDVEHISLVACVLNTIDDALDRSDPGGTDWTADSVKHLRPLLERARRAGRVVLLVSDHGHIVERREGTLTSALDVSSNRSRAYVGDPACPGEIRVRGSRVLKHNGDAILAVDERMRYGPMKAGYHGGAAPAEAIIPICVLATGEPPAGWKLAPPQAPTWWRTGSITAAAPAASSRAGEPARRRPPKPAARADDAFTLFPESSVELSRTPAASDLASALIASPTYAQQRSRSARVAISDDQIASLVRVGAALPGNRLDPDSAAAALGVATVQLAGALPQVQRLLNVEQYPIVSRDADGRTIVLDLALLREQFGLPA